MKILKNLKKLEADLNQISPEQIRAEKAKRAKEHLKSFLLYDGLGTWKNSKHLQLLCEKLEAVERGEIKRLMVFMPPRHGKSQVISKKFPSWFLGRNHEKEIIITSYSADLALGFSRIARNTLREHADLFDINIAGDSAAVGHWGLEGARGGMMAAGVGGPLTGRGANCFPAETMIQTEIGPISIKTLSESKNPPRVLSYDHFSNTLVYKNIIANKRSWSNEFTEITTSNGRKIKSTREHHYYDDKRGYRAAQILRPGDGLISFEISQKQNMFRLATPQNDRDTVRTVENICGNSIPVYDIQVEGTSNFFANGILVHNCAIIDDPFKNWQDASSKVMRDNVREWYKSTLRTRLAPGASIVIVMTRWHEDDLAGWLLKEAKDGNGEQWEVINFPAEAEGNDPLGREVGQWLWPERFSTHEYEQTRLALGSRLWAALYQQHPSPDQGDIFKREWFKTYKVAPATFDKIIQSWDMAFKDLSTSDFVVGQVWGQIGADKYLLDQVRGKLGFPATVQAVRSLSAKWPQATEKVVEDKANGPAVIATLKSEIAGLIATNPEGGKIVRAQAVSPEIEAGNIHVPDSSIAAWIHDFIEEFAAFPNGLNDDQVDATTQALTRLKSGFKPWAGKFEF